MINKNSFIQIMDTLRDYNDALDIMYNGLGINMDNNEFTKVLDQTLDALVDDVEADFDDETQEMPWCYYFAFECDWGRNEKAKAGVQTFGDERVPLTSAAALYDFLMLDNGMTNYLKHTTHGGTWIGADDENF